MAKKLKLPKRIAGIKIPKAIRKGPLGDFMNSRAGQIVIAHTLVAAAGIFTAKKIDPNVDVTEVAKHPGDAARRIAQAVPGSGSDQTERLTFALKEAAQAFRTAMESGPTQDASQPASVKADGESSAKKKALVTAGAGFDFPLSVSVPKPRRKRLRAIVERWLLRRLQRRLEREWSEYQHPPEVSVGRLLRKHRPAKDGSAVYRSVVQIHFHKGNS